MRNQWRVYAKKTEALEQFYTPKIRRVIRSVYSSFTSDLKQHGIEQARSNLNAYAVSSDLLTTLQDLYSKAGLMGARLTYTELRQSLKTETKAGGFGRNARWVQAVNAYLRLNLYKFAASILNTTREDILALLDKVVKGEVSIDDIVQAFKNSTRPESRTRLIVRSEVNRAANVGHSIGAQDFPYEVDKQWIAADDHRTRESHRLVHNHVTSETGLFEVPVYNGLVPTGQIDKMQFPGDPNAHVSNTANCRCRVIYTAKRDQHGNLIPRQHQAPVIPLRATTAQTLPDISIAAQAKAIQDAVVVEVK